MSCASLSFTHTYTVVSANTLSIIITVPTIYPCTNIQVRERSSTETTIDWSNYVPLNTLVSNISYTFQHPSSCSLDIRLRQCCDIPTTDPGPGPLPPTDTDIDDSLECVPPESIDPSDCSDFTATINNAYVRPEDLLKLHTLDNDIAIPTKVLLKIKQNSCSDIRASFCTVRCFPPPPGDDDPTPPTPPNGDCSIDCVSETNNDHSVWESYRSVYPLTALQSATNIYDLPSASVEDLYSTKYGYQDWWNKPCSHGGVRCWGTNASLQVPRTADVFDGLACYQRTEAYYIDFPPNPNLIYASIDGRVYDNDGLGPGSAIKVHTTNSPIHLIYWLENHFAFYTPIPQRDPPAILRWSYVDVLFIPWHANIHRSLLNTGVLEECVLYAIIIPC